MRRSYMTRLVTRHCARSSHTPSWLSFPSSLDRDDLLFTNHEFELLIELGPGPTLTGMAIRALKAKSEASDDSINLTRVISSHAGIPKEIYYQFEEFAEPETDPELATTSAQEGVMLIHPSQQPVTSSTPIARASSPCILSSPVLYCVDPPISYGCWSYL